MTRKSTEEDFWRMCEKGGECWNWKKATNNDGYGILTFHGKAWKAHRLAYHFSNSGIPDGMVICHTCDNPKCVNPDHLYAGTQQQNVKDRVKRRRSGNLKGVNNGKAKLSESDVLKIRSACDSGDRYSDVATKFGISDSHAGLIHKRRAWGHIV